MVMYWFAAPSVSEFTLDSRQLVEEVNTIDLSLTSVGGLRASTSVEIGEQLMYNVAAKSSHIFHCIT